MCGRYTDSRRNKRLVAGTGVPANAELPFTPRYNIAPTQDAWIVCASGNDTPRLKQARWGLIPFWASDEKIGNSLINARAETVATKPAFRRAYEKRRCLVLADGFYEWKKQPGGKQPIYIRLKEGAPFAFGGLWERWHTADREVESFCIITVPPNELCATVHDRMPLILGERSFAQWLDAKASGPAVNSLLRPYASGQMECFPVAKHVNNVRNESEACVQRVETLPLESEGKSASAPAGPIQGCFDLL